MNTLLFRIKAKDNPKLKDDDIVAECMERLMAKWPQVEGYQYERQDEEILILMWGDLNSPEKD